MNNEKEPVRVTIAGGTVWIGLMLFIIAINSCAIKNWTQRIATAVEHNGGAK